MSTREEIKAKFKTGFHITEDEYSQWLESIRFVNEDNTILYENIVGTPTEFNPAAHGQSTSTISFTPPVTGNLSTIPDNTLDAVLNYLNTINASTFGGKRTKIHTVNLSEYGIGIGLDSTFSDYAEYDAANLNINTWVQIGTNPVSGWFWQITSNSASALATDANAIWVPYVGTGPLLTDPGYLVGTNEETILFITGSLPFAPGFWTGEQSNNIIYVKMNMINKPIYTIGDTVTIFSNQNPLFVNTQNHSTQSNTENALWLNGDVYRFQDNICWSWNMVGEDIWTAPDIFQLVQSDYSGWGNNIEANLLGVLQRYTLNEVQYTELASYVATSIPFNKINFTGIPSPVPISKTYAQLMVLKNSGLLIPKQVYELNDFQTTRMIAGTTTPYATFTGPVEPLLITAATTGSFYPEVHQPAYPNDILEWSFTEPIECDSGSQNMSFAHTGHITYRKDTIYNLSAYYDWRNVKNRRWNTEATPSIFDQLVDSNSPFNDISLDVYTFENSKTPILSSNIKINRAIGSGLDTLLQPNSRLPNITMASSCYSINFGYGCYNIVIGTNCYSMTFGINCYSMAFGNGCTNIVFGTNCSLTTFGISGSYMEFGNFISFGDVMPTLTFPNNTTNVYLQSGDSYLRNVYVNETAKYGNGKYYVSCSQTPQNITLTLPPIHSSKMSEIYIKRMDNNYTYTATIVPTDGNIDGELSIVLTEQYQAVKLINNGNNWCIF